MSERKLGDQWSIFHFSQSNPEGEGSGDAAALLRRVADSIENLGEVEIEDITSHSEVGDGDERDLTMTVYYHRREQDG